ncbi:hypothetical protein SARC_14722, partial [Sphaeroforma arctica JP610]
MRPPLPMSPDLTKLLSSGYFQVESDSDFRVPSSEFRVQSPKLTARWWRPYDSRPWALGPGAWGLGPGVGAWVP